MANTRLKFHPDFYQDIYDQYEYYALQADFDVADKFYAEVDTTLSLISQFPKGSKLYNPNELDDIRASKLKSFPYGVFHKYQVSNVYILALLSLIRDPVILHSILRNKIK
ncbi:hypothetical protein FACS189431_0910 [Alphaproteobacteria bacterium]|nr:hypothetical protein FACS189431_0910 [Alphaproteobacteria bacterium]